MVPTIAMATMGLYLWNLRNGEIDRLGSERDRVELNHRVFDLGSELLRGQAAIEAAGYSDAPEDVINFAHLARFEAIEVSRTLDSALKRLIKVEVARRESGSDPERTEEITLGTIDLLSQTSSQFESLFTSQVVGEPLVPGLKLSGAFARETVSDWRITPPAISRSEIPDMYRSWEATIIYQNQLDTDLGVIVSNLDKDPDELSELLLALRDSPVRRSAWMDMNAIRETDPFAGALSDFDLMLRNEPLTEEIQQTLRPGGLDRKFDLVMEGFKYNDLIRADIQQLYTAIDSEFDVYKKSLALERNLTAFGTVLVAMLMLTLIGLTLGEVSARRDVETAHSAALERLALQALRDTTTGAWNRRRLESQLEADLAGVDVDEAVVVVYLDLDRFKAINDVWGHAIGDKILQTVARRLSGFEYDGAEFDVVRFGGDEFVLHSKTKRRSGRWLQLVGEHLLRNVNRPIGIDEREYEISASVGISMSNPESTMHSLLLEADSSLLMAKQSSRGTAVIYNRSESRTGELVDALPRAMANGEIFCHFQLFICSCCGQIQGAEALARWCRFSGEWVSPSEFVPLVESFGLTDRLTETVLTQVSEGLKSTELPDHVKISVNLSAHELEVANFSERFTEKLERLEIDPNRIAVELTETAAVGDPQRLRRQLTDLRESGVTVAVDDFGNGYSPLGYLHELPIDMLKLDRSLVAGIDTNERHQALVTGIVGMLKDSGITVVAEGVEHEAEERWLLSRDIKRIQGFYRARPKPWDEIDWNRAFEPCKSQNGQN